MKTGNFVLSFVLCAFILGITSCSKNDSTQQSEPGLIADTKIDSSQSYKITFIELGSKSCIPCKMMEPVIEEIKTKYTGQVNVLFYDVKTKEGFPYAQKYGVQIIPTQIFLDEQGKEFHRHTGFYPLEDIETILKQKDVDAS